MRVSVEQVSVTINATPIVTDAELHVEPGQFTALLGPNGSGKSTLLRTVYRALRPTTGTVLIGSDDVWHLSARESAKRTAVVAQDQRSDFDLAVREVALLGRIPHKRAFERDTTSDRELLDEALERVGLPGFEQRSYATLSGGERQRVQVARALVQQSPLVLLDEPTNHLDIRFQLEMMELIRGLGVTCLAALHDLNLTAEYCDHVYVMKAGRVVAGGPPGQILTGDLIEDVFGVRAERMVAAESGRMQLAFSLPVPAAQPDTDDRVTGRI